MRMAPVVLALLVALLAGLWCGPSRGQQDPYGNFIARNDPRTPAEEQKSFHLPPGFAIELVAAEPDIIKPINMNFDDRGRLWVTQSVEYPFPVKEEEIKKGRRPRDTIKILEDTNGDGRADRITTFVDGLNIPIGVLPVPHGALVYSIPNIYRVTDTKGTGKADEREVLYGTFGHADTHGMASSFTWGFDGWVYGCHGYSNTSEVKGADGHTVRMQSGNTYRIRPDGSRIEQYTHGQVNPFGLCFDPLGNLYSADCHTRPMMMLLRGAYYESFGKPNDGLGFAPEMCTHDHGSTAIAGIVYYAADHFPPAYRDTIFVGNVVTNRINHDRLERHGSTYKAIEQPDFLICDDPWFRPVDIKLGPDGALYVADFYNRIIGHYEVPLTHPGRDHERGRIWRIVYRGPDGKGKPVQPRVDWSEATARELVEQMGHPNLVVRMEATNQLVERGGSRVIAALRTHLTFDTSPLQRVHILWALERLHALNERQLVEAAGDREAMVRVHVQRILSERPEASASLYRLARARLRDEDAFVRRAAADALGRHPNVDNIGPLLALRHAVPADDSHLLHTVRMALRDQLRPAEVWAKLPSDSWNEADRKAIADAAGGVHSAPAAAFLLAHLQHMTETPDNVLRYVHHVARYGDKETVKAVLKFARGRQPEDLRAQAALFKAMQQGTQERGGALSDAARHWADDLARKLLASKHGDALLAGIELAGSLQMAPLREHLTALVDRKDAGEAQRKAALDALLAIDPKGSIGLFSRILGDGAEEIGLREHAAGLLGRLNKPEAHAELLKTLAVAPARLQNVIAVHLAGSSQGAEKLLDAIASGKASARVLQEWFVHINLVKHVKLRDELARLTPPADKHLQELLQHRRSGFAASRTDPALGAAVFEKHCAACHQIANRGAKIGPQLDGVGVRGLDRLLEDVIDPNRNVDQAFRSTSLQLKNGQLVSGLLLREEGEVLVLADAQGKEVRVPKSGVEERTVSQMSPMPANLVDQIPEADFYNLLAYLLTQRPANPVNGSR
jgi:putative heme-binding domain-containing protein